MQTSPVIPRYRLLLPFLLAAILMMLGIVPAHAQAGPASLTIHKSAGEGTVSGPALPGITFQISPVEGIDLSTPEGWSRADELTATRVLNDPAIRVGQPRTAITFDDGFGGATAVYTNLPHGLYLVEELPARIGDTFYSVVAPFLVTVPQRIHGGLEYNVHVRTKNQPVALVKTTDTDRVVPGQSFTYRFEGSVPAPDIQGRLHRYEIVDQLPIQVGYVSAGTVSLHRDGTDTILEPGRHYRMTYSEDSRTVEVAFTPSGLETLAAERTGNSDLEVRAEFSVRVNPDVAVGTQILNTAHLYPDGYPRDETNSIASNTVSTLVVRGTDGGGKPGPGPAPSPGPHPGPGAEPGDGVSPSSPSDSADGIPSISEPAPGTPGPGEQRTGSLAVTGTTIGGLLAAGLALVLLGAVLLKKRSTRVDGREAP